MFKRTPFALAHLVAGAALLPAAGGCSVDVDPSSEASGATESINVSEPVGESASALSLPVDNSCTAVPSFSLVDRTVATKVTRYFSTVFPNGVDFFSVGVTGPTCQISTPSLFDADCCQANQGNASYTTCKSTQDDSARDFLAGLRVRTPLLLPFHPATAETIRIGTGYYRDGGQDHAGAIDFYRPVEDGGPGFRLYAPADGVVVWAGWLSATGGNLIMVRHTAPSGENYFTEYRHVRGGVAHDKQAACACINPAASTATDRLAGCTVEQKGTPICKYAANPAYDSLWGLAGYSMPTVGTALTRGQHFGYAGNTGTVRDRLDSNGNPRRSDGTLDPTGNTHLHFATYVERPDHNNDGVPDQDGTHGHDLIPVDAFGVYSKASGTLNGKGCYDIENTSTFRRFMAPHRHEAVDLPAAVTYANNHEKYFPDAGWDPQTFNIYVKDGEKFTAVGYSPDAPSSWKRWFNLSESFMNNKIAELEALDWKVRQISVHLESGAPRYTAIWEPLSPGETSEAHLDLSQAAFDQLWLDEVINGTMKVVDHSTHTSSGGLRHNVVLSSSSGNMYLYYDRTAAQLEDLDDDLQAVGWKPYAVSALAGATGSAVRFSAVWRWLPGEYQIEVDQSKSAFINEQMMRSSLGWRLHRVQGYDNGTKFVSIWRRP